MADTGDILRTVILYGLPNSSEGQNVFYHEFQAPIADNQDIVNSINAWILNSWAPAWVDLAPSSASIESFNCDLVNPDGTVKENLGGLTLGIAGAQPGTTGAAAVSGYLLAYTALPKQRGSKYIPGIAESQYSDNVFTGEALGDLAVLLALFLGYIDIASVPVLRPGILSRTLTTYVPFLESGLINAQPAYQRRRKLGVGI